MNWPTGVQRLGNRVSHCYINLLDKLIGLNALGPFERRYFIKLYIYFLFLNLFLSNVSGEQNGNKLIDVLEV